MLQLIDDLIPLPPDKDISLDVIADRYNTSKEKLILKLKFLLEIDPDFGYLDLFDDSLRRSESNTGNIITMKKK